MTAARVTAQAQCAAIKAMAHRALAIYRAYVRAALLALARMA